MKVKTIASILFFIMTTSVQSTVLTVGSTVDCHFETIQAAVDSGNPQMDIRVTNNQIYGFVEIIDKDVVTLKGGYASCDNALNDNRGVDFIATEISGGDAEIALTLNYSTLINHSISISGFDIHNGLNKGVKIKSENLTESLIVEFSDTQIHDNNGQGMRLEGNATEVRFAGKIYNNITTEDVGVWGAGVNCNSAKFSLLENSAIYNNTGSIGAGIYAEFCDINLYAGDTKPFDAHEFGIFNNHAFGYGGGIRSDNSHIVAHGNLIQPVTISSNTADDNGGGLYINKGSSVELFNARIENNTAQDNGGGIFMTNFSNDPSLTPTLLMKSDDLGCTYASVCSSLSFNTLLGTNNGVGGGAISLHRVVEAEVAQTIMKSNHGLRGSVAFAKNGAHLIMEGNLLINNSSNLANEPSHSLFATESGATLDFSYLTIADNASDRIFYNRNSTPAVWSLQKSIIANTNDALIFIGVAAKTLNCSIVHNDSATAYSDADTVIAAPGFNANNSYQLASDSIAIDPSCQNNTNPSYTDIIGTNRLADGNADIGAYEYFDDVIFKDGFENVMNFLK